MTSLRIVLALGLSVSLGLVPAWVEAGEVPIDDPRWHVMSDAERTSLQDKLRTDGVIGPDDTLVYTGTESDVAGQKDNPVLSAHKKGAEIVDAGKEAAKLIARKAAFAYNSLRLKACKLMSNAAEKDSCKSAEAARFEAAKAKLE